jgi:hypothetical protein
VNPEDDPFIDGLARELRGDPLGDAVESRIMRAVRRTPRLLLARRFVLRPLPWSIAASVALVAAGLLGATLGRFILDDEADALVDGMRHVQFVLVSPSARKVSVVGDFNSWDASHTQFQAKHSGGGVWTVTAPIPVGHHRYSFVVDDTLWVADPNAPTARDNYFGMPKSTLIVYGEH